MLSLRLRRPIAFFISAAVTVQAAAARVVCAAEEPADPGAGAGQDVGTDTPDETGKTTLTIKPVEQYSEERLSRLVTHFREHLKLIATPVSDTSATPPLRKVLLTGPRSVRRRAVEQARVEGALSRVEEGSASPRKRKAQHIPIKKGASASALESVLRSSLPDAVLLFGKDALVIVGTDEEIASAQSIVSELEKLEPSPTPEAPPTPKPIITVYPLEYISPDDAKTAIKSANLTVEAAKGAQVVVPAPPERSPFAADPSQLNVITPTDMGRAEGTAGSPTGGQATAQTAQGPAVVAGGNAAEAAPERERVSARPGATLVQSTAQYALEAETQQQRQGAGERGEEIVLAETVPDEGVAAQQGTIALRSGLGRVDRELLRQALRRVTVRSGAKRAVTIEGRKVFVAAADKPAAEKPATWIKDFTTQLRQKDQFGFGVKVDKAVLRFDVDPNEGKTRKIEVFRTDQDTPVTLTLDTEVTLWPPVFGKAKETAGQEKTGSKVRLVGNRISVGNIVTKDPGKPTERLEFSDARPVIANGSPVLVRSVSGSGAAPTDDEDGDTPGLELRVGDKQRPATLVSGLVFLDEESVRLKKEDGVYRFYAWNKPLSVGMGRDPSKYSIALSGNVVHVVEETKKDGKTETIDRIGEVDGHPVVVRDKDALEKGALVGLGIADAPLLYNDPAGKLDVETSGGEIRVAGPAAAVQQARRMAQDRNAFEPRIELLRVRKPGDAAVEAVLRALQDEGGAYRIRAGRRERWQMPLTPQAAENAREAIEAARPAPFVVADILPAGAAAQRLLRLTGPRNEITEALTIAGIPFQDAQFTADPPALMLAGFTESVEAAVTFAAEKNLLYKKGLADEMGIVELGPNRREREALIAEIKSRLGLTVVRSRSRLFLKGPRDRLGDVDQLAHYSEATRGAAQIPVFSANVPNIFLTGTPDEILKAVQLLNRIDIAPPQVAIEARVVEIEPGYSEQLGIQWSDAKTTDVTGAVGSFKLTEQGASRPLRFGRFTRSGVELDAVLSALIAQSKAKVLASPNITVVNLKPANFFSGETFTFTAFKDVNQFGTFFGLGIQGAGINLNVTPQAHLSDNEVTMTLIPTVSSRLPPDPAFPADPSNPSLPRLRIRRADSTVRLANGEIMAIGGLINEEEVQGQERVPLLSELPLVGQLFRYRTHSRRRNEIAIFIQPRIIPPRDAETTLRSEAGPNVLPEGNIFPLLAGLTVRDNPPPAQNHGVLQCVVEAVLGEPAPGDAVSGPTEIEIAIEDAQTGRPLEIAIQDGTDPRMPALTATDRAATRSGRFRATVAVPAGEDRIALKITVNGGANNTYRIVAGRGSVRLTRMLP